MAKYKDCYTSDNGRTYCWDDQLREYVLMPEGEPIVVKPEDMPYDVIRAAAHKLALKTRFEE